MRDPELKCEHRTKEITTSAADAPSVTVAQYSAHRKC